MNKDLTLYSLVWVTQASKHASMGVLSYVGQILSRRTPEGTYMVRRVPGHAGTLTELSEACLKPVNAANAYRNVSYAEVQGVGQFPVDMLRYDNAVPVNFTLLDSDSGPKAVLLPDMGDRLLVAKAYRGSQARWTNQRWNSFMWTIFEVKTLPIAKE